MERDLEITPEAIFKTDQLIRPYIRRTPVLKVAGTDFGLGLNKIAFKLEFLQHSGSFKPRGAFAQLLSRRLSAAGVVAASGGNHGAAVAYAAMRLGIQATIFVPKVSSPAKIARIKDYGAKLVLVGSCYADALAASEEYRDQQGAHEIHAFDQTETLLGQGTLGMEIDQDLPGIDTLLVAVGGGGLIGGIAAWFCNRVKVVAVEPEKAPTLHRALEAGHPVDAEAKGIAADSLAPRRVGTLMFPLAKAYVERSVLVADDAIGAAQLELWDKLRIVTEPGGAAAFAALVSRAYQPAKGERVAVLLCGANTPIAFAGSDALKSGPAAQRAGA